VEEPLVSIVAPTYNRARLLRRSLNSLLAQTEQRFEIIVVDDASQDDSEAVVREIGDARIRYIRLPENRGPGGARNAGVEGAAADLVAFQDSDDEWLPNKLERQLETLGAAGPATGVVYSDMLRIEADGVTTSPHHSPILEMGRWLDPATGFYAPFGIGIQTCLIRRKAYLDAGGFREGLRCFEDLELFLRLLENWAFAHIPEALVRYHDTGGQTTQWQAELQTRRYIVSRHGARLRRESPAFWLKESALVGLRGLLGRHGGQFRSRPYGPPLRSERNE
jgi:glycosyltransferase involved in cell wall biosynthesis